jgi:hypothetical protein
MTPAAENIKTNLERLKVNVSSVRNPKATSTTPVNLATWIKACSGLTTKASKYLKTIERVREAAAEGNTDKKNELKNELPGICPSGLHPEGSPRQKKFLSGHSGFIQVDIDFKENEHLFNTLATDIETLADKLKYILSFNPYIFYAGLSVSGAGLWLLMPVSNEGDHRATYFKIKAAFDAMQIYVDPKAGRLPNDLRLLSYDANPLINPDSKVFEGVKAQPKPKPAPSPIHKKASTFNQDKILNLIRDAKEGERHEKILKASRLMGGYVGTGAISYEEAQTLLQEEAATISNAYSKDERTIKDGLNNGIQHPIQDKQPQQPEPNPKPQPKPQPAPEPAPEPKPVATFRDMAAKNPKLNDLADRFQLDIHNAEKSEI